MRRTPSVRQAAASCAVKISFLGSFSFSVSVSLFDSISNSVSVSDSFSISFSGGQSGDKRGTVGRHCHPFFPFMGEADAPARECSMCSSADLLHQTCIQKEKVFRIESSGSKGMPSGNTTSSPSPFADGRKPFPFLRKNKNPPPHVRRGSESVCSDSGLFR